ncbi:MAG: flagellar biosynthesis anti-sigma factor FlgM [Lachnospiraceae bacterium]|nr:flagellar biosynthesis anti-sigma factor FlgM [Lachnospiraceae bacterium]MBQ3164044.1 flagellar biosynthesis anti-sigma factor FlgM [Lachnospiraceae bacterium]MBQ6995819.1 flagellar biosynthesis anti-sigma factor FlgM [Lachnospiraceae bacterium]
MRIDAYNHIQQLYGTKSIKKTEEKRVSQASFKDQLMLSAAGKDAQIAKQAVANTPDVRESVIVPLKEQIDNGTYEVDVDDLAGKLLEKYNGLF